MTYGLKFCHRKCLQEGLLNLQELTIVGCIDSHGSVEELLSILSDRPGLKYNLECGNCWSDEEPYPKRVLTEPNRQPLKAAPLSSDTLSYHKTGQLCFLHISRRNT